MREKLIELLRDVQYLGGLEEKIADHLIANGVTVQRWIPVTERLPEQGMVVLACGKRHATSGQFQGAFSNDPHYWLWRGSSKYVTHWMPLPEPPKGE